MPRHSPSRSRTDYTGYEFTASAGFDYNYDPVGGRTPPNKHFDPYTDHYSSPPNYYQQEYYSPRDHDTSSASYDTSSHRHDRSPRGYRSSQDYRSSRDYDRSPRHDDYRHHGHNDRHSRRSPRYDDYRAPGDNHPVETTNIATAPSWKIPEVPPPVPPPTSISDDYIRESEKPSSHIDDPSSSRKLLILDLNGTLVFRSPHVPREYKLRHRRNNRNQNQQDQPPPHNPDPYADPTVTRPLRSVHARPYLTSFREYLFHPSTREWLDTMVWSSAQPHSVTDMVEKCFGEKKDGLVAIWARDTLGLAAKDYNRKAQTTKDLAKAWAALPLPSSGSNAQRTSASAGQVHSAHTTLLLDDSPLKAHLQPYNHLCIREYVAELRNADVAFRASDNARPYEHEAKLEEQETTPTESEAQSTASASPVTDRSELNDVVGESNETGEQTRGSGEVDELNVLAPETEEEATGKRKRRRRPKNKKQVAAQGETVTSPPYNTQIPAATYDQTLLAVIGILDNIKSENNVAGWMRSGGLLHGKAQAKGRGKEKADQEGGEHGLESSQEEGRELKRRRISPESLGDDAAVVSTSLNASTIDPYSANTDSTSIAQNDTGQWYEDPPSMTHWVKRGIDALEELAIEIVPGVDA